MNHLLKKITFVPLTNLIKAITINLSTMKKSIFMIISATLITTGMGAQDNRGKITFGVKVGANYSNVYDTEGEEFDADGKLGLAAGVFVAIPIGQFLGFQPELLFSQKGYQSTGTVLGYDYSLTRTSNFIDVPLLLALKPSNFVTVLVGPQYSYLVKQTDVFDNPISNIVVEEEFDNENIRKNTLGFIGGLDVNIDDFVVSARVAWDLLKNSGDGTSTTPRYKNIVGQITLGYRFN